MRTCHAHGCALISAIVPIQYGYPATHGAWELQHENPNHGLYRLGGCVVTPDAPKTQRSWICPICTENMRAGIRAAGESPAE